MNRIKVINEGFVPFVTKEEDEIMIRNTYHENGRREGPTIRQLLRHWQSAPTVEHGTFTTQYAVSAVITEASWQ